jgi:hypothetical protein
MIETLKHMRLKELSPDFFHDTTSPVREAMKETVPVDDSTWIPTSQRLVRKSSCAG